MLTITHMPFSRSARIIFAAEELGIPYRIDLRRRSELKKADVLAINPFGGAPVIRDGELTLMESMAILEYLTERYDTGHRLAPPLGSPLRPKFLQWLHFAEGSLAGPVTTYLRASGRWPSTPADPKVQASTRHFIDIGVGFLDDNLAKSPFLLGDQFTIADIGIYWVLFIASKLLGLVDESEMPNVAAYMARIAERPAAKIAFTMPEGYVGEPPLSVQTPGRAKRR